MKRGLLFALRYELRLWEALFRWAFRRPYPVEPGTVTFSYSGAVAMLFGVFIGLSAVEVPILHLLLPWPAARTISLLVGAYGLFWMIGLRSLPPGGQTQIDENGDERVLSLGVGSQTSIDVLLSRPQTVAVKKAGGASVTQIRFHADDPEGLVAAAHTHLRAAPAPRSDAA